MKLHSFRYWYRWTMAYGLAVWIALALFVSPWAWVVVGYGAGGVALFDRLLRPE